MLARDQRLGRRRRAAVLLHRAEGRRLHGVRVLDLLRRATPTASTRPPGARRAASRAGSRRTGAGRGRPTGASSTTAPRPTRTASPWSERKATVWWDADAGEMDRARRPRLRGRPRLPTTCRRRTPPGPDALGGATRSSCRPTARRWLFVPGRARRRAAADPLRAAGVAGSATRSTSQQRNPARQIITQPAEPLPAERRRAGRDVFPYVATTYRLTEHHTAGGMSRMAAVPVRAAAGDVLRGVAGARRRARPGARRLGDDHHRPRRRSRRGCWSPSG